MTTAAFRNGFLAADRQVTAGSLKDAATRKIARSPNGSLMAVSGRLTISAALLRWFEAGEAGERPKMSDEDKTETWAFIVRPDGKMEHHDPLGWAEIEAPFGFYAIGSGADVAYGAMAMSASAEHAIRIVHQFDIKTGLQVDVLRLEPAKPMPERSEAA